MRPKAARIFRGTHTLPPRPGKEGNEEKKVLLLLIYDVVEVGSTSGYPLLQWHFMILWGGGVGGWKSEGPYQRPLPEALAGYR